MKSLKNVLTFTTHKVWVLHVAAFKNSTKGSGSWSKATFLEKKSPEEFYQDVLFLENINRTGYQASRHRDVVYYYWVTEIEVMEDDRSKFGHQNQKSEREIVQIIPVTYIRGEVMTLGDALAKSTNGKFSDSVKENLLDCISDYNFDPKNLKEEELGTMIIMVHGEGRRETFFEVLKDSEVKVFHEDELLPIKD